MRTSTFLTPFFSFLLLLTLFLGLGGITQAQEQQDIPKQQYFRAEVTAVEEGENGQRKVSVQILDGEREGDSISIEMLQDAKSQSDSYQNGDQVIILMSKSPSGEEIAYVADRVRTNALLYLALIFFVIVVLIGRLKGLMSVVGMFFSFLIIIQFILPNIILGNNPILIALLGGLMIAPVTFYISHGLSWKTTIAVVGTFLALVLTGFLSWIFVDLAHLTGFEGDESVFIETLISETINLRSLLLAGMIIATMGVLDDITTSQASIVFKLAKTSKKMPFRELFFHSMDIGKDHIASLVNTLVLVYTGASLPLFLLFFKLDQPFAYTISNEIVATEIVRTLVGSIGLVTAVPITTFLACLAVRKRG